MTALPSGMPRALFLDLDGTLVDTAPAHAAAFARALAEGAPALLPGFRYDEVAGQPTKEVMRRLGVPAERVDALTRAKQLAYRRLISETPARAFPGARELLRFLDDTGVPWIVVTSGSRGSALETIAAAGLQAGRYEMVCADDVERGKPAPDPYLLALARVGEPADACLSVEDAPAGIASAQAAGVPVVSVHGRPMAGALHFPTLEALRTALALVAESS